MAERTTQNTDQLAFIVVNLGPRPYADVGLALLDLMEVIDAVPGCRTESTGSFPADQRPLLTAYVQATDEVKTERDVELVARVLHREHEQGVTMSERPWTDESDSYRDSFRRVARLHIAAVREAANG